MLFTALVYLNTKLDIDILDLAGTFNWVKYLNQTLFGSLLQFF